MEGENKNNARQNHCPDDKLILTDTNQNQTFIAFYSPNKYQICSSHWFKNTEVNL